MPEAHRFGHVLFLGGAAKRYVIQVIFLSRYAKISIKLIYPYLHEHNKLIMNTYLPLLKSTQLLP